MPKHVGEYIYTYDFEDFAKKNLGLNMVKAITPVLSVSYLISVKLSRAMPIGLCHKSQLLDSDCLEHG